MLPIALQRSLRLALQNLWRNKLLTAATILIMTLILFIFNVIFTVNWVAQDTIKTLEGKVDIILYLDENADPLLVNQLIREVEAFPETTSVTYTSQDDALKGLLEKYSNDLNPFRDSSIENPLPASIQIITEKPEHHATILAYLEQANYQALFIDIESNEDNRLIVQNLIKITHFSQQLLLGIIVAFVIGSLLIIANAIQITIFNRKQEIQIMEIVGANLSFIRSPFLIEGAFYGLCSVVVSLALLLIFANSIDLTQIGLAYENLPLIHLVIGQLIVSTSIGMASSMLALNYYLKNQQTLSA